MPRKPPDWSKTGTVVGYADNLCKQAGALLVLVICPHRSVFSVAPDCSPAEAQRLVEQYVPRLAERENLKRKGEAKDTRLVYEGNPDADDC